MTSQSLVLADGNLQVADPNTGEVTELRDATDRAITVAAAEIYNLERDLSNARRALAAELRDRHGIGATRAGGYTFKIAESQSWPVGATEDALTQLVERGTITQGDFERAMPLKRKPDSRALKALATRLAVSYPDGAAILANACTTSPPSIRDLQALPETSAEPA